MVLVPLDFYTVPAEALTVFYVGALAFSVGGALALLATAPHRSSEQLSVVSQSNPRRRLDIALFLVLCGLPLYLTRISRLAAGAELQSLLGTIRLASVRETERDWVDRIADNFGLLATFVAMALFYENDGSWRRRLRAYAAIALALVYGVLTGSKGPVVWLVLTMLAISWLRKGRARLLPLIVSLLVIVVSFAFGLVMINWFGEVPDADWEGGARISEVFWNYGVGGLVAFGEMWARPFGVGWTGGVSRPVLEIVQALGGKVDIPSRHAEFTTISLYANTNVYTIYQLYLEDFGIIGGLSMMLALGAVVTRLYVAARSGHVLAILFYALAFTGVILTLHGEHFITGLTSYVKALIFWLLIYTPFARPLSSARAS